MKITTDQTLGFIELEDGTRLKFDSLQYQKFIEKILTQSQQIRHIHFDGTYRISKKAQKIVEEEVKRQNERKLKA